MIKKINFLLIIIINNITMMQQQQQKNHFYQDSLRINKKAQQSRNKTIVA